jgi:lipoprotein-anchoring transpeptidase ErfK/SrfK
MPDNFDERLAAAALRLEQEAAVRSPAGVRARGDQRRRRHTATMAVVPVAVLAIAGTVGLTLRPSGAGGSVSGVRTSGGATPSASASTSPGTKAAAAPVGTVDLAHHTLAVLDARGNVVRTLEITAGTPAHPTPTGTFTVVDKKPSKTISSPTGGTTYDVPVTSFIDLGPNAPAIYATPWQQASIGKENATHGEIGLGTDDAAWLYNRLVVGDRIQIGS